MRVIKRKTLEEFWTKHPNAKNPLVEWLIAAIHYNTRIVFALRILTHREYDSEKWKREL